MILGEGKMEWLCIMILGVGEMEWLCIMVLGVGEMVMVVYHGLGGREDGNGCVSWSWG